MNISVFCGAFRCRLADGHTTPLRYRKFLTTLFPLVTKSTGLPSHRSHTKQYFQTNSVTTIL